MNRAAIALMEELGYMFGMLRMWEHVTLPLDGWEDAFVRGWSRALDQVPLAMDDQGGLDDMTGPGWRKKRNRAHANDYDITAAALLWTMFEYIRDNPKVTGAALQLLFSSEKVELERVNQVLGRSYRLGITSKSCGRDDGTEYALSPDAIEASPDLPPEPGPFLDVVEELSRLVSDAAAAIPTNMSDETPDIELRVPEVTQVLHEELGCEASNTSS